MPQNTSQCMNAVYSFVPYGSEFYSVIGVLEHEPENNKNEDDRRSNDLYLIRGSIELPTELDYENIKRCAVQYDPVCNINSTCGPSVKYCMFNNIKHILVDDYNIINIQHNKRNMYDFQHIQHNYFKIKHSLNEMSDKIIMENMCIQTGSYQKTNNIKASHGCNGFVIFNLENKLKQTDHKSNKCSLALHMDNKSYQFQIVNSCPDAFNLDTDILYYQYGIKEYLSGNLLLIDVDLPNSPYKTNKKYQNMAPHLLIYLDYDAMTAIIHACIYMLDSSMQGKMKHIYGGLDNTVIIRDIKYKINPGRPLTITSKVEANRFRILYPARPEPCMDMLLDYLPYEMAELVSKYAADAPVQSYLMVNDDTVYG